MMVNKIAELIVRLDLTAYRFARETRISANTIYALKNNKFQYPSGEVCRKIIETYGVSITEIIAYEEP